MLCPQAAHIVPAGNWSYTKRSQVVKDAIADSQAKINQFLPGGINSYQNGFWAKAGHLGTHTDVYFMKMWELLKEASSKEDVLSALNELRRLAEGNEFVRKL